LGLLVFLNDNIRTCTLKAMNAMGAKVAKAKQHGRDLKQP
jgi:hypothetical protein